MSSIPLYTSISTAQSGLACFKASAAAVASKTSPWCISWMIRMVSDGIIGQVSDKRACRLPPTCRPVKYGTISRRHTACIPACPHPSNSATIRPFTPQSDRPTNRHETTCRPNVVACPQPARHRCRCRRSGRERRGARRGPGRLRLPRQKATKPRPFSSRNIRYASRRSRPT